MRAFRIDAVPNPLSHPRWEREGPTAKRWEGEGKVAPRILATRSDACPENLALTLPRRWRGPLPLPPEAGEGIGPLG